MRLRVADDGRAAAVGEDNAPLGHRLDGVVGALAVHVRAQQHQQPLDRLIPKDHHVVDPTERTDQFGAVLGRQDRPPAPFQQGHRPIVVHRHDEPIGLRRRSLQISHVADVQQIEAAVRERDRAAALAIARHRFHQLRLGQDDTHTGEMLNAKC